MCKNMYTLFPISFFFSKENNNFKMAEDPLYVNVATEKLQELKKPSDEVKNAGTDDIHTDLYSNDIKVTYYLRDIKRKMVDEWKQKFMKYDDRVKVCNLLYFYEQKQFLK